MVILLAYDGSADARAAVENAAELFAGQAVTVLTVWETFAEVVARTTVGFGLVPSVPDAGERAAETAEVREWVAATALGDRQLRRLADHDRAGRRLGADPLGQSSGGVLIGRADEQKVPAAHQLEPLALERVGELVRGVVGVKLH